MRVLRIWWLMCVGVFERTQARAESTVSDPRVVEGIKLHAAERWTEKHNLTSELHEHVLQVGTASTMQIRPRRQTQLHQKGYIQRTRFDAVVYYSTTG